MITFFNAGAGSGKTHTLSEELLGFLLEQNGKPAEVILTTFTIKSAEELKERVRSRMHEKGQPDKAAELSGALIGTINSVCSRLVEKYALEEGLSPELRVLDEQAAGIFFSEFITSSIADSVFERLNELCSRFSLYDPGDLSGSKGKDTLKPGWPRMVKCLGERFRAYHLRARDVERSKAAVQEYITGFLQTSTTVNLATFWQLMETHKEQFPMEAPAAPDMETVEGINALAALALSGNKAAFKWDHFAKAGSMLTYRTAISYPWLNQMVLLCREFHRSPEFLGEYLELTMLLYDAAFAMIENYQQYKQERGLIDFSDQELILLKLLKENEVVRREIASSFRLVMVDEFQDCNPVQLAIFSALSAITEKSIWVGDPKQAIYGFRDSDAELFNLAMNAVESVRENRIRTLPNSFRSRPPLVHAANQVFSGIFSGLLPEDKISLVPCEQSVAREKDYRHPAIAVQFYEEPTMDAYLSSVARQVAEVLRSDVQVFDRELGSYRKLRGGDIALLLRTNANIQKAAKALKAEGLEVSCQTEGLQQQAEVCWITSLLRLLINTGDSLAIANLMLLENAVENVDELVWERLLLQQTGEDMVRWIEHSPVSMLITGQRELLTRMPLQQSIAHLVTASGLPAFAARWGNFNQRMATINRIIELAATFQQQAGIIGLAASFSGFIEHLGDCLQLPASRSRDAVTVMTIHKSKGLEWPMVYLVKLDMMKNDGMVLFNQVHVVQPERFHFDDLLQGQKIIYMPWPFASLQKVPDDLQQQRGELDRKLLAFERFCKEDDRLLYVAFTRAREYLVLPHFKRFSGAAIEHPDRKGTSPLFTAAHFQQMKAAASIKVKDYTLNGITVSVQRMPRYAAAEKELFSQQEEVVFYDLGEKKEGAGYGKRFISPSTAEKLTRGISLSLADYRADFLPLAGITKSLYATLGDTVHHAFASWQPEDAAAARTARLKDLICRMQMTGHLQPQDLDDSFDSFWRYINSRYQVTGLARELPLTQVNPLNGMVTSGIADLVLETPEGLILVDHKTFPGHFESMALNPKHHQYAGKYAVQLQTYKQLLEKSTGQPVCGMLLHYVVQGRLVEIKINQPVKTNPAESPSASPQLALW